MTELKTKPNDASVVDFLNSVENERKRADSFAIMALMKEVTGEEPRMWGSSIVGYGSYHYKYASGQEADWPLVGFSPRKQNLTLYVIGDFDRCGELLSRLGKHKTSKVCLYLNKLSDIDQNVLRELVAESFAHTKKTFS